MISLDVKIFLYIEKINFEIVNFNDRSVNYETRILYFDYF